MIARPDVGCKPWLAQQFWNSLTDMQFGPDESPPDACHTCVATPRVKHAERDARRGVTNRAVVGRAAIKLGFVLALRKVVERRYNTEQPACAKSPTISNGPTSLS